MHVYIHNNKELTAMSPPSHTELFVLSQPLWSNLIVFWENFQISELWYCIVGLFHLLLKNSAEASL